MKVVAVGLVTAGAWCAANAQIDERTWTEVKEPWPCSTSRTTRTTDIKVVIQFSEI